MQPGSSYGFSNQKYFLTAHADTQRRCADCPNFRDHRAWHPCRCHPEELANSSSSSPPLACSHKAMGLAGAQLMALSWTSFCFDCLPHPVSAVVVVRTNRFGEPSGACHGATCSTPRLVVEGNHWRQPLLGMRQGPYLVRGRGAVGLPLAQSPLFGCRQGRGFSDQVPRPQPISADPLLKPLRDFAPPLSQPLHHRARG
jgi:hypothetical protein